jgi:hypothetical protein
MLDFELGEAADTRLHVLQAELLFAQYQFINGKGLEGRMHLACAVSIAVASGLHHVRFNDVSDFANAHEKSCTDTTITPRFELPPSRDWEELEERIKIFWMMFVMDRCWSITASLPPLLTDCTVTATQIDKPWHVGTAINNFAVCAYI